MPRLPQPVGRTSFKPSSAELSLACNHCADDPTFVPPKHCSAVGIFPSCLTTVAKSLFSPSSFRQPYRANKHVGGVSITKRLKSLNASRLIVMGVLFLPIVVVLGVHVYAEIYRIRVERLLAILKTFQVEETPAAAVLKLRHEYGSNAANQGACSEEHCEFWIALTESESLLKPSNHARIERSREFSHEPASTCWSSAHGFRYIPSD